MAYAGSLNVPPEQVPDPELDVREDASEGAAVLAGGCFWCVEAVYQQLDGVRAVTSGYAGGTPATADYGTVCSGATDHAEAVEIRYDPARISYGRILKVFFSVAHDPTQKDRQGADVGRQYRSAIFYRDAEQRRVAESYIRQLDAAGVLTAPIVTEVVPLRGFYRAEDHHQDYARRHPLEPYILFTARPKVEKVKKHFAAMLARR
ncbi:MAG: peptide-methionine (S)-S-oxide reductase MsrA [Chloroflexota bacterium]|nr:peptide-methionine (S)-S-oxide reductase MsrA [Chloroflexota bacterium]MDE3193202.1 peptide-methionine (S)-S-oxide reductase MsrA [Chloroflexota bacterium]